MHFRLGGSESTYNHCSKARWELIRGNDNLRPEKLEFLKNRIEKHSHVESRSIQARGSEWSSGFSCCGSSKLQPVTRRQFIAAEERSANEQPLTRASPRVRKHWLKPYPLSRRPRRKARPLTHAFERHECGDCFSTLKERTYYGILLCASCTVRLLFPDLQMSETASA